MVDGVPQGRQLDFDLTSNQGLGRQAHCVIAFERLSLDVGRKIPADEVVAEVIRKIGVRMMTVMADYRWTLKIKDRPDVTTDLEQWIDDIDKRSTNSLVKHLFDIYGCKAPIEVDPDSENDVIALFASLLANEFLKGYALRALSGSARYDAIVNIANDFEIDDHGDVLSRRDSDTDLVGINKVLEYKYSFQSLLDDFESKKKNPREVGLCVCWNLPHLNVARGDISYTYAEKEDTRSIYGGTHIWVDENDTSRIPIISLHHVCAILARHKEKKNDEPDLGSAVYNNLYGADKDHAI